MKHTRAIIDAIHSGGLSSVPVESDPVFGFAIPQSCPNVPSEMLSPRKTWADPTAYDQAAKALAARFRESFSAYEDKASEEILRAAPVA